MKQFMLCDISLLPKELHLISESLYTCILISTLTSILVKAHEVVLRLLQLHTDFVLIRQRSWTFNYIIYCKLFLEKCTLPLLNKKISKSLMLILFQGTIG